MWATEVSDSPLSPGAEGRVRQELVTRAGRNVVLATNAGAVVALDALTGKRAWGFAYPRAAKRTAEANRSPDPAPAVAAGGRVFVAPADADRVYALDAETGRLLWESSPADGAQILGVTSGRVVVTITGPTRGLRGLNVVTGSHWEPEGWAHYTTAQSPQGAGRGLVTDRAVLWPSGDGIFFLSPTTGYLLAHHLPPPPGGGRFGNLAYADGVLVVVTPTQVWGFVGQGLPPPTPTIPRPGFEAVADAAERHLGAGDEPAARKLLLDAARGEFPAALRARAVARLVLLTPPGTDESKLPADVRAALGPAVRNEWVLTAGGELLTLGGLIDRHAGRAAPARPPPVTLPPRRPDDAPTLGPDARAGPSRPVPPGSFPLLPVPGATAPAAHLFVTDAAHLTAVPVTGGPSRRAAAADRFTHAADLAAGFIAAGPFAVAVYGAGADPEWVFRVPETDPLPAAPGRVPFRTGGPGPLPQLSSFTLAGDWLLARLGEHHLLGLDLAGRRVGWVLGGHGRPRY
ncbi:MAG TPA: PQQ-binding-like beta-propeller repeat protein, partial [Urbifossiella sp.]|nr:PQQ-binding-like beta-propeller repeat protein [Urbifossiella sp.]